MPSNNVPMALVYDFDGTLAPGNLQENSFIPDIGMDKQDFWREVDHLSRESQADRILMYMYLMLDRANAAKVPVRRDDFKKRGADVSFFNGVEVWFNRIKDYGRARGVNVEHYIVSSGNAEIIEGTSIAKHFKQIYGSKSMYDENGAACWPALAINFTTKTQFLFRINKGAHNLSDDKSINKFVPMNDRPVPFESMVYIGDGETDVPCFRLVKELGGLSVAVFKPKTKDARKRAEQFATDGRVDCIARADYTEDKQLDQVVKSQIDLLAAREMLNKVL